MRGEQTLPSPVLLSPPVTQHSYQRAYKANTQENQKQVQNKATFLLGLGLLGAYDTVCKMRAYPGSVKRILGYSQAAEPLHGAWILFT